MRFSTSRFTCTAARPWPVSSAMRHGTIRPVASWAAMKWKHCRLVCPSWPRSSIRGHGDARSPQRWKGTGAWGRSFTAAMEGYPRMAGMWLVGEDMPQDTNRVTLDPKAKDKFGMPVASVHYDDHPHAVAMRDQ